MISDDTIISEANVAYVAAKKSYVNQYSRLEYIQSTGTQYIKTDFVYGPSNYNKVSVRLKNQYTQDGGPVWHVNGVSHSPDMIFYIGRTTSNNIAYGNGADNVLDQMLSNDVDYVWNYDTINGTLKINDDVIAENINFTSPTKEFNFILFGYTRYDGGQDLHSERLYEFSVFENEEIIAQLIPVKRKTDNAIGMLDLVTEKFFSNSGTGAFVMGPEIPFRNDYENKSANLATVARLFKLEKQNIYLDKPLSISNFKYFYDRNLANQNLYSKYTQLEYVEGDGAQYIDTGYYPNQDTRVVLHCDLNVSETAPIFGARTAFSGSQSYTLWAINGAYRFDYQAQNYTLNDVSSNGRRFILTDGYSNRVLLDQKTYNLGNYTFSVPNTLHLFALMENQGLDSRHSSGKIYLCNIFSGSGTNHMERRFIPAKRNSDGVAGLLDILDATFYESLGEPWIAGPEVGPMPNFSISGYDILEYAQSSTETYVDTEFTPDQDSRVTMEMQKVENSTTTAQYIYCSRSSKLPEYGIIKPGGAVRWRDGYANERTFLSNDINGASLTQRMIIDKNKNITYIGHGTVSHNYTNFTTPNTMALYGCFEDGDGSIDYDIDMRLYWCRIYDNGILIRNYYPVKRQSDNKVGLYDFVNDSFSIPIKGTLSEGSKIPIHVSKDS